MAMASSASTANVPHLSSRLGLSSSASSNSRATLALPSPQLRSSFLGLQVPEARPSCAQASTAAPGSSKKAYRPLLVKARTAAEKTIEVEIDKPLGIKLGQKPGGGVIITAVEGNAAKAGLKVGDQVIYTSSFFGDELWPADKLGFTKTAIQAKPDSVYFVINRGGDVDVKKLPKRPAPPRFGRKLTEAQKARATHVCLDCGYIYTLAKPFDEQADTFLCPQCRAPKKRFVRYDPETGRALGGGGLPISVLLGILVGAVAVGGLLLYGLQ